MDEQLSLPSEDVLRKGDALVRLPEVVQSET